MRGVGGGGGVFKYINLQWIPSEKYGRGGEGGRDRSGLRRNLLHVTDVMNTDDTIPLSDLIQTLLTMMMTQGNKHKHMDFNFKWLVARLDIGLKKDYT